jgi:hypothetical protein
MGGKKEIYNKKMSLPAWSLCVSFDGPNMINAPLLKQELLANPLA